jgi:hypothetical protein
MIGAVIIIIRKKDDKLVNNTSWLMITAWLNLLIAIQFYLELQN